MLAGGVESMTRAPFVMGKATEAFSRSNEIYDTTIGWRFVNTQMQKVYGTDAMPETGENVAEEFQISRADQDKFAYRSQMRAKAGAGQRVLRAGDYAGHDQGPQGRHRGGHTTSIRAPTRRWRGWRSCSTPFRDPGTVTAGNASGVNDGAAALIIASEDARAPAWTDAARAGCGDGDGRRAAAHHGHRSGARRCRSCWRRPGCRSAMST